MRLLSEQKVDISCPVERVYAYATNLERFAEWFPAVLSVVSVNDQAHAEPGKEYLETVKDRNGVERKIKLQVKEARRNALFVSEGEYPPLMPRMEIVFESSDERKCSVTWRMYSRNRSLFARFTWLPLARRIIARRAADGVNRLREKLEAES